MSEFSAWRGEVRAQWSVGAASAQSAHVPLTEPLRALYKLRRRIPKPIRPPRMRLYRLCWDAVYLHEHGVWVTRPIARLYPNHIVTLHGEPVTLEISIRIHD